MEVDILSFCILGQETIFVTSKCGRWGVDIDVISPNEYICNPVGCSSSMTRTYDNRKEALTFAENWCSIL